MKRNILIELTPLLDVILILLFLVLMNASTQVDAVRERADSESEAAAAREAALQTQLSEAENQRSAAEQALTSFALVDENCRIFTLTVEGNGAQRSLYIAGEGMETQRIPLRWGQEAYAKNALRAALQNAAVLPNGGGEQAVFFIFQYDRNTIYQADYALIHAALLHGSGGNVYFAEYDKTN